MTGTARVILTHGGLLALLLALNFVLPAYHHGILARVMVLATYAVGYNILFGYTGLLSLGHAMFFAAGMYGLALPMQHLGLSALPAFGTGIAAAALLALVAGALALRTTGVAFMIVTLMFAQSAYLTILLAGTWTRGDEGFVIAGSARQIAGIDLSQPGPRYLAAFCLFAAALLLTLVVVRRPFGRVLIAIRENEDRTRLLGYDTGARKLAAVVLSGADLGGRRGSLCPAVRLCGGQFRHRAVLHPAASLGAARAVLAPSSAPLSVRSSCST